MRPLLGAAGKLRRFWLPESRMRVLRFGLVAALVAGVLILAAEESAALTALALAGLAVAGLIWWWWRSPDVAGTVASLVLTCVLLSEVTYRLGVRMDLLFTLELGLAFWWFAVVVAVVVWLARRHRGNRAVTVAAGHGVLLVAAGFSVFAPAVVPIAGLVVALLVVAWRSRPRRRPPRRPGPEAPLDAAARARGVGRTREALDALGDGWRRDGEVVTGPNGVFLVQTRAWSGRVGPVALDGGEAYGWNGDPDALGARLEPVVRELRRLVSRQGLRLSEVTALVVFWDDTVLPGGGVEMQVLEAGRRGRSGVRVSLVRGEDLPTRLLMDPMAAAE